MRLTTTGDLTALQADAFDTASAAVPDGALTVLDLGRVGFLDSAGIGCLVRLLRRLERQGGELRLAGPTGPVTTALELVRLHRLLEVHPDTATAVASFASDVEDA